MREIYFYADYFSLEFSKLLKILEKHLTIGGSKSAAIIAVTQYLTTKLALKMWLSPEAKIVKLTDLLTYVKNITP